MILDLLLHGLSFVGLLLAFWIVSALWGFLNLVFLMSVIQFIKDWFFGNDNPQIEEDEDAEYR